MWMEARTWPTECTHEKYSWRWLSVVDGEMLVTYECAQLGLRLACRVVMINVRLQNTVKMWPSWL